MKKILFVLLFFFLAIRPVFAADLPAPKGFVNDFAEVLTDSQKATLEQNLQNFKDTTGNEIAVAIIKDLGGDTVENVAVKTFEQWKIGQKGKDNGVLLLIAINDRKLRIEVGYGLEPILTDAKAGDIIRNIITPKFKQSDYYGGISDGINAIEKTITNPDENFPIFSKKNFNINPILWFIFPLAIYFAAFLGRSKAIWPGGLIGLIIGAIIAGLVGALVAGLIGLFLDWILSRNYERLSKLGKKTGFWNSGGGFWAGGSSGSNGGFGGFSGGSSGGGGSSGSW